MKRTRSNFVEILESRRMLAGQSQSIYMIGNSMTDGTGYNGLVQLLQADGSDVSQGRQTGPGFTQIYNYELRSGIITTGVDPARPNLLDPWGNYQSAFAQASWNDLSLQPASRHLLNDVYGVGQPWERNEAEVPVSLLFMEKYAVNSPNGQVLMYSRPSRRTDLNDDGTPNGTTFDYASVWNQPYDDNSPTSNSLTRSFQPQLIDDLRAAQAADPLTKSLPPVRLIPAGEAFYNLEQMIKAGQFSGTGVTSITDFYSDASHPSVDLGRYTLGLSFYSAITGYDPRQTATAPNYIQKGGLLDNAKVQSLIKQAVYDAMTYSGYAGMTTPIINVPVSTIGSITGRLWNDVNGNGIFDASETISGVRTVFIDTNQNGLLDAGETSVSSDANGVFTFSRLHSGTYAISRVMPAGYRISNSATADVLVTVAAPAPTSGADIGSTNLPAGAPVPPPPATAGTGAITGVLWNDLNSNGIFDPSESATGARTVFLDTNRNGKLDAGEASVSSNNDGTYSFKGLSAGTYAVSRVFPSGYYLSNAATPYVLATVTDGATTANVNIGTTNGAVVAPVPPTPPTAGTGVISGVLWNDLNNNGVFDPSETVTGARTVFLDANKNGLFDVGEQSVTSNADGTYSFTGLSAGTYAVSRVFPYGYHLSNAATAYLLATVGDAATTANVNLGTTNGVVVAPPPPPASSGTISGLLWNDVNGDGVIDSSESATGVRTVFLDANKNGLLDAGEQSVSSGADGKYTFAGLSAGTYAVSRVFPAGYHLSNAATPYVLATVAAGATTTEINLGTTNVTAAPDPNTASVSGTLSVTNPADAAAFNSQPWVMFLDFNNDGIPGGKEPFAYVAADGSFTFGKLPAGKYGVDILMNSGWSLVTPASGIGYPVTLGAGQTLTGETFVVSKNA